ncbi:MAG: hypothetical protein D6727_09915 [Gammaproteobacteria bacterium]|nr:MAG: hypothetical protein D6727_09915 [Gammaproteobacteria bacterium]
MTSKARRCGWLLLAGLLLGQTVLAAKPRTLPLRPVTTTTIWQGENDRALSLPTDVAVGADGVLYVVDSGHDRVVMLDAGGGWLGAFGSSGDGEGQLDGPVGIGIDPASGTVYVADRRNDRLQTFSASGEFLRSLPVEADGKGAAPVDVAVRRDGSELYVSSAAAHRVLVLDPKGELLRQWGEQGDEPGQFHFPASIALAAGRVYVVDVLNARIQSFDRNGGDARPIGKRGGGPGTFFRPKGLAIGADGTLFAGDSFFGVIQAFAPEGEFLYALGGDGKARQLDDPVGMSASGDGLLVVEMLAGRLQRLQLGAAP